MTGQFGILATFLHYAMQLNSQWHWQCILESRKWGINIWYYLVRSESDQMRVMLVDNRLTDCWREAETSVMCCQDVSHIPPDKKCKYAHCWEEEPKVQTLCSDEAPPIIQSFYLSQFFYMWTAKWDYFEWSLSKECKAKYSDCANFVQWKHQIHNPYTKNTSQLPMYYRSSR